MVNEVLIIAAAQECLSGLGRGTSQIDEEFPGRSVSGSTCLSRANAREKRLRFHEVQDRECRAETNCVYQAPFRQILPCGCG